jgi:hypothetical protein
MCEVTTQLPRDLAERIIVDAVGKRILDNPDWRWAVWQQAVWAWSTFRILRETPRLLHYKVNCGRRSIGFVWFHSLWETIQKKVLF